MTKTAADPKDALVAQLRDVHVERMRLRGLARTWTTEAERARRDVKTGEASQTDVTVAEQQAATFEGQAEALTAESERLKAELLGVLDAEAQPFREAEDAAVAKRNEARKAALPKVAKLLGELFHELGASLSAPGPELRIVLPAWVDPSTPAIAAVLHADRTSPPGSAADLGRKAKELGRVRDEHEPDRQLSRLLGS